MLDFSKITTEKTNPRTNRIDAWSIPKIIEVINREDQGVAKAVSRERKNIAKAIVCLTQTLRRGRRLFFVGAGTSGRLGVLEAAECPPTFHTRPGQIQAIMAGGKKAVFKSQEGAEDNAKAAAQAIRARIRAGDVVIGIAASGVTPFVSGALNAACEIGCSTILITCNANWRRQTSDRPDVVITLRTGPEVIAGSTRMKAGTATKMILNILTTASMIRLGKAYGNRMVDLEMKSKKLRERAIRMVQELAGLSRKESLTILKKAQGRVKAAILMAKKRISRQQAIWLLKYHQDSLRKALLCR